MNEQVRELTKQMRYNVGISSEVIKTIEESLGFNLPKDYLEFINEANGAEGRVGNSYLVLWKLDELQELNKAYSVNDFAPGIFLFGSNGADNGYAFDLNDGNTCIVEMPFIGMSNTLKKYCSKDFLGFLVFLHDKVYKQQP